MFLFQAVADDLQIYELSRNAIPLKNEIFPVVNNICKDNTLAQLMCVEAWFWYSDTNVPLLNLKSASHFYRNTPAGISSKQLHHFSQLVTTGKWMIRSYKNNCSNWHIWFADKFQQYDYGPERNRQIYNGLSSPPAYNISKVNCHIYVMYGTKDYVTPMKVIKLLIDTFLSSMSLNRIHFNFRASNEWSHHLAKMWKWKCKLMASIIWTFLTRDTQTKEFTKQLSKISESTIINT